MTRNITLAIDFGSSRTKIAYFDTKSGKPKLLTPGRDIQGVIPSVFHIPKEGEGKISVGDDATDMLELDPDGIVFDLKRELHRNEKKRLGGGRPAIERVELAGHLFRHIREWAETEMFHGMTVDSCILTVPARFEDYRRECIKRAAELGGFVNIQTIEEPVAAAKHWLLNANGEHPSKVIVCDVGGGTTDFAILELRNGRFIDYPEVPPTMIEKGGNDIDKIIQEKAAQEGGMGGSGAWSVKIKKLKETAKRMGKGAVTIFLGGQKMEISKEIVDAAVREVSDSVTDAFSGFLDRCRKCCGGQLPPILLVGGAARLEGLKGVIEGMAQGTPVYLWNESDYATVLGAALEDQRAQGAAAASEASPQQQKQTVLSALFLKAEQGDATAQCNLGLAYWNGQQGVSKNPAEAVKWFHLAAKQGVATAQSNLGFIYKNGVGVPQDHAESVKWYRLAAEEGIAAAQYQVGLAYANGSGVSQNYVEAAAWFHKAANQGYAKAQYSLGESLEKGHGALPNLSEAVNWYIKASEQKHAEALEAIARVKQQMAMEARKTRLAQQKREVMQSPRQGDVAEKVISIVAEQMGVDAREIGPDTRFVEDLNADSLDTVELVMEFEDEFELHIPDQDAEKTRTVGAAIDYIIRANRGSGFSNIHAPPAPQSAYAVAPQANNSEENQLQTPTPPSETPAKATDNSGNGGCAGFSIGGVIIMILIVIAKCYNRQHQ